MLSMAAVSHASRRPASGIHFVGVSPQVVVLPDVHATQSDPCPFSMRSAQSRPAGRRRTRKGRMMRLITKSLTGAVAAIGIAATAPAFAGVSVEAPAQAYGLQHPDQENQYYQKTTQIRYYSYNREHGRQTPSHWRGTH